MHVGTIDGFFGIAHSGSQYHYEAEYSADEVLIRWSARVLLDGELKGTPSGLVYASVSGVEPIEHHIRDLVTSAITNHIAVDP